MFNIFEKAEVKSRHKFLYITFFCMYALNGLLSASLGNLLPFISAQYNLSYTLSGVLLSVFQVGALLSAVSTGPLSKRFTRKKTIMFFVFMTILGIILLTSINNAVLVISSFVFLGLMRGTLNNICNVVASEFAGNKPFSINTYHLMFSVGSFLSPIVIIFIAERLGLGWKAFLWFLGILSAAGFFCIAKTNPDDSEPAANNSDIPDFWRSPSFWFVTLVLLFYLISEVSVTGWLVTYFKESGKLSPAYAKLSVSFVWLPIIVARIIYSAVLKYLDRGKLIIVLSGLCALSLLFMLTMQSEILIIAGIMLFGFFAAGVYPITMSTMPSEYANSATAMGISVAIPACGTVVTPLIIGAISENFGITSGIILIVILLFITMALTVVKYFYERKLT